MCNWQFCFRGKPDGTPEHRYGSYENDDLKLAVLYQYSLEVLGNSPRRNNFRKEIKNHAPIQALVKRYKAEVYVTGLAVDLLTLRPEICLLIFIPDTSWYTDNLLKLNNNSNRHLSLSPIPIQDDSEGLKVLVPKETTPAGAAAFWVGIDHARFRWRELKGDEPEDILSYQSFQPDINY